MADNPTRGDSTDTVDPNYGKSDIADKETDPDKVATAPMSLKGLVALTRGIAEIARDKQTTNVTINEDTYDAATQIASVSLSGDGTTKTTVDAWAENTGSTNALDFAIRGRFDDGTDQSNWEVLAESTNVAAGESVHLSVDHTAADEVELAAKENASGSDSTAQGYANATGA